MSSSRNFQKNHFLSVEDNENSPMRSSISDMSSSNPEEDDDEDFIISNSIPASKNNRSRSNGIEAYKDFAKKSYSSSTSKMDSEDSIIKKEIDIIPSSSSSDSSSIDQMIYEDGGGRRNLFKRKKRFLRSTKSLGLICLSICLFAILLFFLGRTTQFKNFRSPRPSTAKPLNKFTSNGKKRLSLDNYKGFQPFAHTFNWLKEAGDGVYSEITQEGIILNDLRSNTKKVLLSSSEMADNEGNRLSPYSFTVSSDLRYVMIPDQLKKQWRYSTLGLYWVFDTALKRVISLHSQRPVSEPQISLAAWSATGHSIAYVYQNDIYIIRSPDQASSPLRITTTGTSTIFNGVCDWVYEEEVLSGSTALWWSPDSKKLVWLSFDETNVKDYQLTVFNPTTSVGRVTPYNNEKKMKYPKPGFSNPIVTIKMLDLEAYEVDRGMRPMRDYISELRLDSSFDDNDRIVMEVAWVSENELIVREINRIATKEKTGYFNFSDLHSKLVGVEQILGKLVMDLDFSQIDGGWAEPGQFITPIMTKNLNHDFAPGYLDVRIDPKGFRHIAYFSPPSSNEPIFLSRGEWEVDESILAVDFDQRLVYFVGANPSTERHLYSTKLPNQSELQSLIRSQKDNKSNGGNEKMIESFSKENLRKITQDVGYYSADFSSFGGFYLLSYNGPELPWQKLVKVGQHNFTRVVESNERLNRTLNEFELPKINYRTIKNSVGQDMNAMEILPLDMDFSGKIKYPVLFRVYGGPNSQMASKRFSVDWNTYLSSELNYLVVNVDGRGTGFKGRKFRVEVRDRLGKFESMDMSSAAKFYAKLKYVDPDRIGIWGWSYGGYLTCKTAESYSSDFSMALAVAPVIDWRYYDSIYTERYMSTPELNLGGYQESSVSRVEGFKNLSFSLAHGSADDNVHFLNSAELLDRLTGSKNHNFQFRLFIDSDHGISTRGAYPELMRWMTDWLLLKWGNGLEVYKKQENVRLDS